MKVQKTNLKHWSYLIRGGLVVTAASVVKNVFRPAPSSNVILYGHTFNGNLRALADYINTNEQGIKTYYATLDPHYYKELASHDDQTPPLNLLSLKAILLLAKSGAIISDREAHVLEFLNKWTSIPFVDVWHGIPFKGFTARDFAYLQPYEEIWTTSDSIKDIYIKRFRLSPKRVIANGYARTDKLVNKAYDADRIKRRYSISEKYKKIVLVAPTWQQDDKGRSIIPFGVSEQEFFRTMERIGKKTNTLFIFRAHLNVRKAINFKSLDYVKNMPYVLYPEAEDFLAIADVLVTDWSSICFDYLPLKRPAIFLDVPAPFKNNFTVAPEHRFGKVVGTIDEFINGLEEAIDHPAKFINQFKQKIDTATQLIYGNNLDGKSAERQVKRLKKLLKK